MTLSEAIDVAIREVWLEVGDQDHDQDGNSPYLQEVARTLQKAKPFIEAATQYTEQLILHHPELTDDDGISFTRMLASAYWEMLK